MEAPENSYESYRGWGVLQRVGFAFAQHWVSRLEIRDSGGEGREPGEWNDTDVSGIHELGGLIWGIAEVPAPAATFMMEDTPGGNSRGTMTIGEVPAVNVTPASLNGKTIAASAGLFPFRGTGTFAMLMGTGTYTATGGPTNGNSNGTYTFEAFSGNVGVIVLDDLWRGFAWNS